MKADYEQIAITANKKLDNLGITDVDLRADMMHDIVRSVKRVIDAQNKEAKSNAIIKRANINFAIALEEDRKNNENLKSIELAVIYERKSHHTDVWMSNALNAQSHSLNLNEKRIMMLAATKLRPDEVKPGHSPVIKIQIKDLIETFGMSKTSACMALMEAGGLRSTATSINKSTKNKQAESGLTSKSIKWSSVDNKGNRTLSSMVWTPRSTYHKTEGWLELHIWHEVVPFLTKLSKNFTRYSLADMKDVTSKNTWRLYEIILQFKSRGEREIDIEDLIFMLDLKPSYVASFALTKQDILDPAVVELSKVLPFTYEAIRLGKKVIAVKFTLGKDSNKVSLN